MPLELRVQTIIGSFQAIHAEIGFAEKSVFEPSSAASDDSSGGGGMHDIEAFRTTLHRAFSSKCEGLMVKELGSAIDAAGVARLAAIGVPHLPCIEEEPRRSGIGSGRGRGGGSGGGKASSAAAAGAGAAAASLTSGSSSGNSEENGNGNSNTAYLPSKRCSNWIKLKKDYLVGLADTLDVIPIGGFQGTGRKKDWFSPFLVAVYVLLCDVEISTNGIYLHEDVYWTLDLASWFIVGLLFTRLPLSRVLSTFSVFPMYAEYIYIYIYIYIYTIIIMLACRTSITHRRYNPETEQYDSLCKIMSGYVMSVVSSILTLEFNEFEMVAMY